ncbi:MAG: Ig-like domain-containing protein [Nitrospirae bacterium]|nr:Ig-like domain-containing protein [Nitrospirota bacterium]
MVRTRFVLFMSIALLPLLFSGCPSSGGGGSSSSSSSDTTPPTVSSTQPAADATGIALNTTITATFSEAMDATTLTAATFILMAGGTAVTGTVSYTGTTATFTPSAALASNTLLTAKITTGAQDLAHNPLAADFSWQFTTAPDTTPPTVISTNPANNAVDVPLNSSITATFSEPMDHTTLSNTTFIVSTGGVPIAGRIGYSSTSVTFTPTSSLINVTDYTATITTGVKDLAGNSLAADFAWSFTSGGAIDNIPPTVISTTPATHATNVPFNTTISATFSEAMDPSSITTDSFKVSTGGGFITGTVNYSGTTATFTPDTPLASAATYTASIKTFAKDLAGNALAADYNWQFGMLTKPTLCVIPGGGGVNNCYATINGALAAAKTGDIVGVAAGTYPESVVANSFNYNVLITQTVTLEGGWDISFNVMDPVANVTTITPLNPYAVVAVEGVPGSTSTVAPTIDGFTITGAVSTNHGGGLRIQNSDAIVQNNIITNNTAYFLGGGAWVQNGAPQFKNNQITNNTVTPSGNAYGGGIELENTTAALVGNTISGNTVAATTGYGGGVYVDGGGPVKLIGNTIDGNTGSHGSGYGGGVSIRAAAATLNSNIIDGNSGGGSGAVSYGGGIYVDSSSSFVLNSNTITGNVVGAESTGVTPSYGGGVYITTSQGSLSGNTIANNIAAPSGASSETGWGGGLAIVGSTVFSHNDKLTGNSVRLGDGCGLYAGTSTIKFNAVAIQDNNCLGLYLSATPYTLNDALVTGNTTGGLKAVTISATASPGVLINNTFVGNNSGEGINTDSALTIVNNIIMGHATGVKVGATAPVSRNNDFYNNTTDTVGFSKDASDIIPSDPLFISISDYHLTSSSPLIDAGTHGPIPDATSPGQNANLPDTDMDGQSRAMIGTSHLYKVDIGADEFAGNTPRPQRIVNLDGGGADLTIIGPGGVDPNASANDWIGYAVLGTDINGDGKADLTFSAEDWVIDFNNPPHSTGRLFGLSNTGSRKTGTLDLSSTSADLIVDSRMNLQHLGSALTGGDLNGDGHSDLIAGSYQDDGGGGGTVWPTVFAFWGGSSLTGTRLLDGVLPSDNHADFALRAPGQDFFAFSSKNALTTGDLNGDGIADLIVGDGLADNPSPATADTGAIFVIFGGSGLTGLHDLGATPADYTLYGAAAADKLQSVAVGLVDSDAQADLVARTDTTAYVFLGPITGTPPITATTASADLTITGLSAGGVAVMDITGDNKGDLILGSGNIIYILPGPLAKGSFPVTSAPGLITLTGIASDAVFSIGNVVGSSNPDLIIGSPSLKRVFVIAGGMPLSGTVDLADASATFVESAVLNKLGYDVTSGDLDNDSRPDLIVSTWQQNVTSHPANFQDAGLVYVIYGK